MPKGFFSFRFIASEKRKFKIKNSSRKTACEKNNFWSRYEGLKMSKIHRHQSDQGFDWWRWPRGVLLNEERLYTPYTCIGVQHVLGNQPWNGAGCRKLEFRLCRWAFKSIFEGLQILQTSRHSTKLALCLHTIYGLEIWYVGSSSRCLLNVAPDFWCSSLLKR